MYHEVYCDYWEGKSFNRTEEIMAWMPLPTPYGSQKKRGTGNWLHRRDKRLLQEIRAEIADIQIIGYATVDGKREIASRAVMQIIDKYRESEVEE